MVSAARNALLNRLDAIFTSGVACRGKEAIEYLFGFAEFARIMKTKARRGVH
jgi:hypothetical protein